MKLNGRQKGELRDAILDAYKDPEELGMVILLGMDINLTHITIGSTYQVGVFKLIQYVESKGILKEFVDLIVSETPNIKAFEDFQVLIQEIIKQENLPKELASTVIAQVTAEDKGDHELSNRLGKRAEEEDKELKCHKRLQDFNDYMRQIDFNEAKDIFNSVLEKYGKKEAPVLLLMHESKSKKGDLYLQHIINNLKQSKTDFQRYPRTDFKPYSIGCSLDIVLENEKELLNRIATWFEIEAEDAQETDKIITKIVNSIRYGTILLFHLNSWNRLANPGQTCLWFVENFWKPLVREVSSFCTEQGYYDVKVILMIDSPGKLDEEIFDLPCVCSPNSTPIEQIQQDQVITIPLRNWQKEEIQDWLDKYIPMEDMTNTEGRKKRAKLIYDQTEDGIPEIAYNRLWDEYNSK